MWVHYYYASMVWELKLILWSIGAIVTFYTVFEDDQFDPRSGVTVDGDANREKVRSLSSKRAGRELSLLFLRCGVCTCKGVIVCVCMCVVNAHCTSLCV